MHDESMVPTLRPGDRLLVDPAAYRDRAPAPGDIVVLLDPADPDRWLVKRVARVGPDHFWVTRTGPGRTIPRGEDPLPTADAIESLTLPPGTVFVLGDGAGAVRDSRQFGPVPLASIVGRVDRCYAPPERRRAF